MKQPQPLGEALDLDMSHLQREMDRTKSQVFLNNNAAFLGPLMCSMDFQWSESLPTAATNGSVIWWNPRWFLKLPAATRKTVLVHELMHVAYLHMLRRGDRDPEIWNYAADIHINNELERERYSFEGVEGCWKDQQFGDMATEDIYDVLYQKMQPPPCAPWGPGTEDDDSDGHGDMIDGGSVAQQAAVNNVVQAIHAAKLAGGAGKIPGQTEVFLKKFLEPKVPWETLLYRWFTDLGGQDYSWSRPNRRYQDLYLPSLQKQDDRLEHLAYYLDVSGSISDQDVLRFNSEVKFIKEQLDPEKLTLIQFSDNITSEKVFTEDDPFDEIVVVGRGGTAWAPVKAHIEKVKPTCAVIFTDLGFWDPITPLAHQIPVLWTVNHDQGVGPFGKTISIKE